MGVVPPPGAGGPAARAAGSPAPVRRPRRRGPTGARASRFDEAPGGGGPPGGPRGLPEIRDARGRDTVRPLKDTRAARAGPPGRRRAPRRPALGARTVVVACISFDGRNR